MKANALFTLLIIFSLNTIGFSQSLTVEVGGVGLKFPEDFRIQGPDLGKPFPINYFQTMSGQKIDSDYFYGKTVVLNIWYVGCKGCKQEEPYLKLITEKFKKNNEVFFLGLCMSKKEKVRKHFEKNGEFGYETTLVERKVVEDELGVYTSPTHFIIKNGILVEKFTIPIAFEELMNWYESRIYKLSSE